MEGLELSSGTDAPLEVDKFCVSWIKILDAPTCKKSRSLEQPLGLDIGRIRGGEQYFGLAFGLSGSKQALSNAFAAGARCDHYEWNEASVEEAVSKNQISQRLAPSKGSEALVLFHCVREVLAPLRVRKGVGITLDETLQVGGQGLPDGEWFSLWHEL